VENLQREDYLCSIILLKTKKKCQRNSITGKGRAYAVNLGFSSNLGFNNSNMRILDSLDVLVSNLDFEII
jgi:hypothetical protein